MSEVQKRLSENEIAGLEKNDFCTSEMILSIQIVLFFTGVGVMFKDYNLCGYLEVGCAANHDCAPGYKCR